jgi:hypothetical protein
MVPKGDGVLETVDVRVERTHDVGDKQVKQ